MMMLIIDCLCYTLSCLPDHVFMGMINPLLLNCLRKWPIKANRSKPVSAFWASWTPWYNC